MPQGKGVVAKAIVGCKIWFPHGSVGSIPTTRTNTTESYDAIAARASELDRRRHLPPSAALRRSQPCQGRGRGFESLRPLQLPQMNQYVSPPNLGSGAYIGVPSGQCKPLVSDRKRAPGTWKRAVVASGAQERGAICRIGIELYVLRPARRPNVACECVV